MSINGQTVVWRRWRRWRRQGGGGQCGVNELQKRRDDRGTERGRDREGERGMAEVTHVLREARVQRLCLGVPNEVVDI